MVMPIKDHHGGFSWNLFDVHHKAVYGNVSKLARQWRVQFTNSSNLVVKLPVLLFWCSDIKYLYISNLLRIQITSYLDSYQGCF